MYATTILLLSKHAPTDDEMGAGLRALLDELEHQGPEPVEAMAIIQQHEDALHNYSTVAVQHRAER